MIFSPRLKFYILKLKDHKIKKQNTLNRICEYDNFWYGYANTYISNTDWGINTVNWFDFSFSDKDRIRYSNHIRSKYKKSQFSIDNSWFNQYKKEGGSNHSWHDHRNCDLTNIYFLELSDKSLRTQLIDPFAKKIITPRVNEGDLLIFPSYIVHKSPENYTKTRKTVISFNVSFL